MLKVVVQGRNGKPLVILGLTFDNLDHLRGLGNPVTLDLGELLPGVDAMLAITAGESMQSIAAELRAMGIRVPEFVEPLAGQTIIRRPAGC